MLCYVITRVVLEPAGDVMRHQSDSPGGVLEFCWVLSVFSKPFCPFMIISIHFKYGLPTCKLAVCLAWESERR